MPLVFSTLSKVHTILPKKSIAEKENALLSLLNSVVDMFSIVWKY